MKLSLFLTVSLLCNLLLPFSGICQANKIDSLLKVLKTEKEDTGKVSILNRLAEEADNTGNDGLADSLNKIAFPLAKKLDYKNGIAGCYMNMGDVFYRKGDLEGALKNYSLGLNTYEEIGKQKFIADACMEVGKIYCFRGDFTKALKYVTRSLQINEKLDNKAGIGAAYADIGNIYEVQGDYANALINYMGELAIYKQLGNTHGMTSAYINIGLVYDVDGDYPEALKNELLGLELSEKLQDKSTMASAYVDISLIYDHEHNYTKALQNDSLGLKLNEELNNKENIGVAYGTMGMIFEDEHKYPEALKSIMKVKKIAEESGNKIDLCGALGNEGNIYYSEGKYPEALNALSESKALAEKLGDKSSMANNYITLGNVYARQNKYAEAGRYYDSAQNTVTDLPSIDIKRDVYFAKAALDSATANYKDAYHDYKQFILYRDSLNNQTTTRKIVSEQMTYDFEKKQSVEKAEQDKKDALASAESRKQKIIVWSVGFSLLLALLFAAFIFRSLRVTRGQKRIIEVKNKETEEQKKIIEEKNKGIIDSINYAKRIQVALLKEEERISARLPNHFILFIPKDIVSGDFYWAVEKDEYFYMAAADCTGHGVPGGFMSMLGVAFLNEIMATPEPLPPSEILNRLRAKIIKELRQTGAENETKDGMDISLMRMNFKTKEIQWSGANNPLYMISGGLLKEIQPDKQPIGYYPVMKPFTNHTITLPPSEEQNGNILYLFSDGYADQFGGPNGKKFKAKQLGEQLLAISEKPTEEQKNILAKTFTNWKGNFEQVDDVLIIGIKV